MMLKLSDRKRRHKKAMVTQVDTLTEAVNRLRCDVDDLQRRVAVMSNNQRVYAAELTGENAPAGLADKIWVLVDQVESMEASLDQLRREVGR